MTKTVRIATQRPLLPPPVSARRSVDSTPLPPLRLTRRGERVKFVVEVIACAVGVLAFVYFFVALKVMGF